MTSALILALVLQAGTTRADPAAAPAGAPAAGGKKAAAKKVAVVTGAGLGGALVGGAIIALTGASIVTYGRRLRLVNVSESSSHGLATATVVYLRPFRDERSSAHPGAWLSSLYAFSVETEEEQMVIALNETFGECLAIARPDDRVPLLGAKRILARGDQWLETVKEWLGRAKVAIVRVSDSPGISAELKAVCSLLRPEQIVLLVPNVIARGGARSRQATREFVRSYSCRESPSLPVVWPFGRSLAAIVYFDAARQTIVWKLVRPFASNLRRPYLPMFSAAFEQVERNMREAANRVSSALNCNTDER
jgi:hypothetical protein